MGLGIDPCKLEALRVDDISDATTKAFSAISARFGNAKAEFDPALTSYARSIKLENINLDRLVLRAVALAASAIQVDFQAIYYV